MAGNAGVTKHKARKESPPSGDLEEILRKIGENRAWMRKPSIIAALVQNPKVPLTVALPLVKFLGARQLRSIIRDPNLADGLRITARKFLDEKRK